MGISPKKVGNQYLFLLDSNEKDLFLLRHILAESPFNVSFGSKGEAWGKVSESCGRNVCSLTDHLLFGPEGIPCKI